MVTVLLALGLAAAVVALIVTRASRKQAVLHARAAELKRDELEKIVTARETELAALREKLAGEERETEHEHERVEALEQRLEAEEREEATVRRDLRIEREWNRELRVKLAELHQQRGALGDTSDVRSLVLRVAIELLGAEKGLLLSRKDEDGDGDLDLVCTEGFEHDPGDSAVAQHFATEVVEQDRTVRAEAPEELGLPDRTPADDEIENLCAIPIYLRDRFSGIVVCANKQGGFEEYDDEILLSIGDQAGAALDNARLRGRVRQSYLTTVKVLADAIEAKDRELIGHSSDVSGYVTAVAGQIGMEPGARERLVFASLLHDIGKIAVSELILLKPGPLTPDERSLIEQHPRVGYRLVEQIPELADAAVAILHHHERWDGDGYPSGLRGDKIPLEARLVAVADAFSAMLTDRPYCGAMSLDEACAELRRCAGTQFDPEIVRLFVEEVTDRPLPDTAKDALSTALADPEVAGRLEEGERVLGARAVSTLDALPLLYSHRHLHESAAAEAARAQVQGRPFAVVIACLPGLEAVNRNEGYAAGDAALRQLAEAVVRVAAGCGGTAARESGSRIALLVPGIDLGTAEQLASRLTGSDGVGPIEVHAAAWQQGDSGDDVIARARQTSERSRESV